MFFYIGAQRGGCEAHTYTHAPRQSHTRTCENMFPQKGKSNRRTLLEKSPIFVGLFCKSDAHIHIDRGCVEILSVCVSVHAQTKTKRIGSQRPVQCRCGHQHTATHSSVDDDSLVLMTEGHLQMSTSKMST